MKSTTSKVLLAVGGMLVVKSAPRDITSMGNVTTLEVLQELVGMKMVKSLTKGGI